MNSLHAGPARALLGKQNYQRGRENSEVDYSTTVGTRPIEATAIRPRGQPRTRYARGSSLDVTHESLPMWLGLDHSSGA